jgi:signal transduction histidine kinase
VLAHASPVHDGHGRLLGAVNVLVDISDRKQAEDELRRTAAERDAQLADLSRLHDAAVRLSATPDLQPVLVGIMQTACAVEGTDKGLLSLSTAEAGRLTIGASLGFDEEFLRAVDVVPPGAGAWGACVQRRERVVVEDVDADPQFAPFREAARRAGFRAVHSTPPVTRDGRTAGVLSTHFAKPHRPTRRQTHLIDLLARQALEAIENARLREADRKKGEFLAVLAHELRNPLAPIQNAVQILRARGPADPHLEGTRAVIERPARQLSRLVDDLLDLSRITTGKLDLRRARIDLGDVLQSAVETSRPLIEAAGVDLDLPGEPVPLDGDQARLAQVVSNLLNNAARYTDRGGRVTLAAERQGSDAVVRVRDTGIGIPADMLPHLIDMFTHAHRDRSAGGLGLGLALVKKPTELHGGTVEVRSDGPGRGSEFTVRLPVALEPAARRTGEGVRSGPSLLVLVVDNRDAVSSLAMLLRLLGH